MALQTISSMALWAYDAGPEGEHLVDGQVGLGTEEDETTMSLDKVTYQGEGIPLQHVAPQ